MANRVCPICEKEVPRHAVFCQMCGEKVDEVATASDDQNRSTDRRKMKKSLSLRTQIFAGGSVGLAILLIGLGLSEPSKNTKLEMGTNVEVDTVQLNDRLPTSSPSSQFSSPGVDHAAEMETCKSEIGELVASILDWQWGVLQTFNSSAGATGKRRVRRAVIRYVSRSGAVLTDRIVCSFDEPPVGNDFFISS